MPDTVPKRHDWYIRDGEVNCELDLQHLTNMYIAYMFDRTVRIFKYDNLPSEMTDKDFEHFTQLDGKTAFIEHNGRYYVLQASFKDFITWNKEAKSVLIVNPALPDLKNEYEIDKDCVIIPNDSYYVGLYPMMESNAIQLASTDISLMFASFNTRLKTLFTSDDDPTTESINAMLDDIWNGKKPTAITSEDLYKKSIDGVKFSDGQSIDIKSLIELKQYIKANWYIDLGINANYNMKREAINENESQMNDDALIPLIDDMLECRKKACEKINKMFGLNITVDLSSSWKKLRDEIVMEKKQEEAIVNGSDEKTEDEGGESNENE